MVDMSATIPYADTEAFDFLIEDIRSFIDRIQHPRLKEGAWLEQIRHTGEDLVAKLAAFPSITGEKHAATYKTMKTLIDQLQAYVGELAEQPNHQGLKKRYDLLERSYEAFLNELKKRRVARAAALAQSRQLKPTNYARNLFHAIMGLSGVFLYYFVLTHKQALAVLGTILVIFGTLEITRRFSQRWNNFLVDKFFGAISRPSERYRTTSATIYLTALILIVWLFPKLPVLTAVIILSISDPAASLAGKRWGRRKLFRDKSIIGTLTFFVVGTLTTGALIFMVEPGLGTTHIAAVSATIAAVGAITELLSSRIDDNFSIPIACAIIATLLL